MPDFGKLEEEAQAKAKQGAPGLEKEYEPQVEPEAKRKVGADAKSEEDKLRDRL